MSRYCNLTTAGWRHDEQIRLVAQRLSERRISVRSAHAAVVCAQPPAPRLGRGGARDLAQRRRLDADAAAQPDVAARPRPRPEILYRNRPRFCARATAVLAAEKRLPAQAPAGGDSQ